MGPIGRELVDRNDPVHHWRPHKPREFVHQRKYNGKHSNRNGSVGGFEAAECNALTSTVPSTLANLRNLTVLVLDNNLLTGTIPSAIFFLPSLLGLYVSGNNLQSSVVIPMPDNTTPPEVPTPTMEPSDGCELVVQVKPAELVVSIDDDPLSEGYSFDQTMELVVTMIAGNLSTLEHLVVTSDFDPYFYNLTNSVRGVPLSPGTSVSTWFTVSGMPLLNEVNRYAYLTTPTVYDKDGNTCMGTDLSFLEGGIPLVPVA